MNQVQLVVPAGFDDPGRPSGGNLYDLRIATGLSAAGWHVGLTTVRGSWPTADPAALAELAAAFDQIEDGQTVLVDGLLASPAAAVIVPQAERLRVIVLLHMPLVTAFESSDAAFVRSERAVLRAVAAVVTTSEWTRQQILTRFALPAGHVWVAHPGVDRASVQGEVDPGRASAGHFLCVGALAPHKGQDMLVEALAGLSELPGIDVAWQCVLVGAVDRAPDFVQTLEARLDQVGLGRRVRCVGVLTGEPLRQAYRAADLLVVPSRSETYGMVVSEGLSHGLPVVATAVGGLPEALGRTSDGRRPGQLVPPDDPEALTAALARWLTDPAQRRSWRGAVAARAPGLPGWPETVRRLELALRNAAHR